MYHRTADSDPKSRISAANKAIVNSLLRLKLLILLITARAVLGGLGGFATDPIVLPELNLVVPGSV